MSGGLVALLDDVAALARMAAASVDDVAAAAGRASSKAMGVIIDDAAVTPRYVEGLQANRELSIIWRITRGSLRNKLIFILPALLLMSEFLPWLLTPLLMCGGAYLCYEGAEKIWHVVHPGHDSLPDEPASAHGPEAENRIVSSATRTDFILSAEIMVISLNEVVDESLLSRAIILAVVAIGITVLVYGVVALIVRMDDLGLRLAGSGSKALQSIGLGLVKAMPKVMSVLATVGVAAMLWVGGHIILVGTKDLGWPWLYERVHDLEELVSNGFAAWSINTSASAALGLVIGALVIVLVTGARRVRT